MHFLTKTECVFFALFSSNNVIFGLLKVLYKIGMLIPTLILLLYYYSEYTTIYEKNEL